MRGELLECDDRLSRPESLVTDKSRAALLRLGTFELDLEAEQLLKNGRLIHLQPQPFKLLCLLTSQAGKLVTRDPGSIASCPCLGPRAGAAGQVVRVTWSRR
jgi:hypothetical protein